MFKFGMAVLEWLRLLNLSFAVGVVPMYWRGACIVPMSCTKGRVTNVNLATREFVECCR